MVRKISSKCSGWTSVNAELGFRDCVRFDARGFLILVTPCPPTLAVARSGCAVAVFGDLCLVGSDFYTLRFLLSDAVTLVTVKTNKFHCCYVYLQLNKNCTNCR